ncbi:MAG: XisI protein [Anaerolineae bacterium]|nr:XisI protein [Anaerolineae bacterium]
METLRETLLEELRRYTGKALNGYSYLTSSADQHIFTVISVGQVREKRIVNTGLVVILEGDQIIIERDVNDKPLVDALIQAGIPREQIILAYAGEAVPEMG